MNRFKFQNFKRKVLLFFIQKNICFIDRRETCLYNILLTQRRKEIKYERKS